MQYLQNLETARWGLLVSHCVRVDGETKTRRMDWRQS